MNSSRIIISFLTLFILLVPAAPSASATTSAEACFCYITGTGATKVSGATTQTSCESVCKTQAGKKLTGAHWVTEYSQYPASNLFCYAKQSDCEKNMDGDEDGTIDGKWSTVQPADCLPGSHYCYPATKIPTNISISILGKSTVVDFGDYIGLVYNYLLGFALVIAIVFMMIGGIRYVIGASSGEIGKAKEMIVRAVTGFVLLLFAWLILFTVNPQLIRLQVPRLPIVKKASLSADDCATILGIPTNASPATFRGNIQDASGTHGSNAYSSRYSNGVIRFTDSPECGFRAEVIRKADGTDSVEGTTCNFAYCAGSEKCIAVGNNYQCNECREILGIPSITPNAALCESLDLPDTPDDGTTPLSLYRTCGYISDVPTIVTIDSTLSSMSTLQQFIDAIDHAGGTCASLDIACDDVPNCAGYNDNSAGGFLVRFGTATYTLSSQTDTTTGDINIVDVCHDDPCGAGAKMTTNADTMAGVSYTCQYNSNSGCQGVKR